ncbi:MAG: hypothetical protein A2Y40_02635 [Candidatus Margulisbacteria bacterium GWF2_35_9]|nr:MAG: hypothetical protein A2Y40_02635 [Candidatus Margulisbacteria bacterium GWF2_35_9]
MENQNESPSLITGSIIEGTISGVTSFGAFVKFPGNEEGLVHISEIANEYVTNIADFVTLGDKVKVKVLGLNKKNKYDLSLKQTKEDQKPSQEGGSTGDVNQHSAAPKRPAFKYKKTEKPMVSVSPFEDRMSKFLKKSEEKLIDLKRNIQTKQGVKKRKKR